MDVSITELRRGIFDLANRAIQGETIRFTYKGRSLLMVPETHPGTSLDKVTKLDFIAPGLSDLIDDADMKAEMQAEWEKDWEEQGLV